VREERPVAAEGLAVRVNVLVEVAGLSLKDAVTPVGKPPVLRVTFWLKPPDGTMAIRVVPLLVRGTVTVPGAAVSLKLPTLVIFSVMVVVAFRLPEMPVIVTVVFPFFAELLAVRVRVLALVAGLGLKAAVTPVGKPEAESVTLPLKPLAGVIEIVLVPWLPWARVRALGLADSVKLGAAITVRLMVVV
jgi:hypothetical protein